MLKSIIINNRSYRRFDENTSLSMDTLEELVDLARLSPSAANRQPLKYYLSVHPDRNESIFTTLSWAGYLKNWPGPARGERPTGFIIILGDHSITDNFYCDHGIAAQSILLGAVEKGLGGCIIAAIDKPALKNILNLPDHLEILLVLALGKPIEKVVLEKMKNNEIRYWRDENQIHHVPKRQLQEIIIGRDS